MEYHIHLGILILIYLLLAQSLNLTFGLGKLLNLAHIASYSIGAYTTAIIAVEPYQQSFFVCLSSSFILSGLFAVLIAAISFRLDHDYFAIGTIAFAAVVNAVLINWKELTKGVLGIPGIPRPKLLGFSFESNLSFSLLLFFFVAISLLAIYVIFKSRFALFLRAQSENQYSTMALGISPATIRNICFVISSALAGLAGSFFAYYMTYIDPSSFTLHEMVFVLSIVIIGFSGSFYGVCLSTIFLVLLPESLRFFNMPPSILGPMRQLLYSLILFAVVSWQKEKLFPKRRSI